MQIPARLSFGLVCGLLWWTAAARAQSGLVDLFNPLEPIVFFPPPPPVFGAKIENTPPGQARFYQGRRVLAPDGMADFVSDGFYPALSTRLYAPELSRALEARVRSYHAKRLLQVSALLDQFVTPSDAPDDTRERELLAFAATQTPQLVALEIEAEQLREALVTDGLRNDVNWNGQRRWKLDAGQGRNDWAEVEGEFQVVRATAFYQPGLTSQQRGLVRELAMELQAIARKARGQPSARTESDAMFFSPETSRFRLPPNLSPALRERIGVYNSQKSALKRELRELITAQDRAEARERNAAFVALADRQWPHLGILERLADDIRVELAGRFTSGPPAAPPWIPTQLMDAIRSYNDDRDVYFGELRFQTDYAAARVPPPAFSATPDERVQQQRAHMVRQAEARRQATLDFQQEHAARFAALELRYKAIRLGLTTVAEKQTDRKTGRPMDADTLLRQHAISMEEFNTFGRESVIYTHYRMAMFQRGLSPEQRRLLFGYALAGLAQPLPYGELMPRKAATKPYPSF